MRIFFFFKLRRLGERVSIPYVAAAAAVVVIFVVVSVVVMGAVVLT